ncbi:hypothetical protein DFH09DRAFT_1070097 [Mycena vulgaris]|nr:hypothetical protein DFH09DRAFT_1070097 [Mycena vulgaris]
MALHRFPGPEVWNSKKVFSHRDFALFFSGRRSGGCAAPSIAAPTSAPPYQQMPRGANHASQVRRGPDDLFVSGDALSTSETDDTESESEELAWESNLKDTTYAETWESQLTPRTYEFAVKRYRSHRGVQAKELEVATAEWQAKVKKAASRN